MRVLEGCVSAGVACFWKNRCVSGSCSCAWEVTDCISKVWKVWGSCLCDGLAAMANVKDAGGVMLSSRRAYHNHLTTDATRPGQPCTRCRCVCESFVACITPADCCTKQGTLSTLGYVATARCPTSNAKRYRLT